MVTLYTETGSRLAHSADAQPPLVRVERSQMAADAPAAHEAHRQPWHECNAQPSLKYAHAPD